MLWASLIIDVFCSFAASRLNTSQISCFEDVYMNVAMFTTVALWELSIFMSPNPKCKSLMTLKFVKHYIHG